ncbi:MAG: PAS domain S-box protein [Methanoregula sp.]|jgi:PAS domain S-box-containing protein|nr:PAS domain S-box protein [Methanoregula sp.]
MASYTVLYVDDEPDLLLLGKTFLEMMGDFTVDTAESASKGLVALRARSYDAVISDFQMPETNGLGFLMAVRTDIGDIPFILFTGRGREEVVIEAINHGVDFYLQKGGDVKAQFAELAHKIRMAVERKRAQDEHIKSDKLLSTIFHASPIHQMITEHDTGRIIDINDRFLKDLKLSRGDALNRTPEEAGLVFDPHQMSDLNEQLRTSGIVRNVPVMVRTSSGRVFTSLTSMTRVQVHGKDLVYTQSVDISAQKKAQYTIDALINAPTDVSMLLATDGTILAANHAASVRYDIPKNDLIGMNAFTLTSPCDSPQWRECVAQVLISKTPCSAVDDHGGRFYENRLYPVLDTSGEVSAVAIYSHDTTEEVRARQALKESEEKYRLLAEHSHDAVYIYRGNDLLFINRQAELITGFSHDELLAMNIWDLVHPDDRKRLQESAARRLSGDEIPSAFYARLITKDGIVRDGEFYVDFVEFSGKHSLLGIFRDITTKKRDEEAIRERERQLRSLSDNLPNGMVYQLIIEPGGKRRFAHVSAGVTTLHEVTAEEVMRDASILYAQIEEKDQLHLAAKGKQAVESQTSISHELKIHTPSGMERWILVRSAPRVLPDGSVLLDGIELDITATKRAQDDLKGAYEQLSASQAELQGQFRLLKEGQEQLAESEDNYRRIIENMQDVFYRTDLDGVLTMISTYGARLVGFNSAEEMIGKLRASDFYSDPKERSAFLDCLKREHVVSGYPLTLQDRYGNPHAATASSRQIYDKNGKFAGIEGILHDVSQIRNVEKALRQANRQITLMTSITRHDIRNQLMALNGWLELSRASIDDPDRMLDLINREQNIAAIIGRQIEFTTIFDDMGLMPPVWQDLDELIRKSGESLPFMAVQLDINLPKTEIFADPLLEKVFYNLFDNALRYGGAAMTRISISAREDGDLLTILVEDNGVGVPARNKKRLFEQGHGNNTGLGLFLVREILAITGLTICEAGIPGKGARFEIRVPMGKFRSPGA